MSGSGNHVIEVDPAQLSIERGVLTLSVSTSASLILASQSFLHKDAFKDEWPIVSQLKHDIETYHSTEPALRLIESGAFRHALEHPIDDIQVERARYVVGLIRQEREDAAQRLLQQQEAQRSRVRAVLDLLRRFFGWLFGLFHH